MTYSASYVSICQNQLHHQHRVICNLTVPTPQETRFSSNKLLYNPVIAATQCNTKKEMIDFNFYYTEKQFFAATGLHISASIAPLLPTDIPLKSWDWQLANATIKFQTGIP